METIKHKHIPEGKKIYFVSDLHLGIPDYDSSLQRERIFIDWLEKIRNDAFEIYLMGDVFDFWFEYKTVVPKGYTRMFGKLAELTDAGIPIYLFKGNHDIWAFDYLNKELNIQIHRKPMQVYFNDSLFFLSHGDGIGSGDRAYKVLKFIFELPLNQFLFNWIHPDIGTRLGLYFSRRSRIANVAKEEKRQMQEPLEEIYTYQFAKKQIENNSKINYFIFGHNHQAIHEKLSEKSEYLILGDWISYYTYASFDGTELKLEYFKF